jgi:ribokinase
MNDIIIIGSLNMDLVVKTARMPGPGETLHGQEFHLIPGGKGANQAVATARLGGKVGMVGRVGADSFGEILRANLLADHVDASQIKTDPAAPTGVALIVVEERGENRIIVVGGANRNLSEQDIEQAGFMLRQARILVVQFEVPMGVVESVARLANQAYIPLIVNASPVYPIAAHLFPLIDYLVVNEHEAGVLAGAEVVDLPSARQAARVFVNQGTRHVILTLGELGSWVSVQNEEFHVPSWKVEAVDTTAAGDAFIGGLAVSLLDPSTSLQEKIRFANAAGAVAATRLGAQSSLPTRQEVEALLAGNIV